LPVPRAETRRDAQAMARMVAPHNSEAKSLCDIRFSERWERNGFSVVSRFDAHAYRIEPRQRALTPPSDKDFGVFWLQALGPQLGRLKCGDRDMGQKRFPSCRTRHHSVSARPVRAAVASNRGGSPPATASGG
jgi:hypothetical protein